MPTDHQLIDGFEALRAEFLAANPGHVPTTADTAEGSGAEFVLDAWLRATLDIEAPTGAQMRALRALRRLAAQPEAAPDRADATLTAILRKTPKLLPDARRAWEKISAMSGNPPRPARNGHAPTLAGEAAAWSGALPRLSGPRAYAMLRRLGKAAIAPDAALRRLLWRLGLVEETGGSAAALAKASSAVEELARLTGLAATELETLLRWHTTRARGLAGGGRCGAKPDCDGCPLASACLHFRFAGASGGTRAEADGGEWPDATLASRLEEAGAETMGEAELLALLLGGGSPGREAIEAAENLLRRGGGLQGLRDASPTELRETLGVGPARARQIKAGLELGRRLTLQPLRPGDPFTGSADVWEAFRSRFAHIRQEHLVVLLLDSKNRVIKTEFVSKGTLTGSMAHPREVFKHAVRCSASALILMHNHPSGDPTPSAEDAGLTRRISEAGQVMGIRVLDHIILGDKTYYSFKDEGRI